MPLSWRTAVDYAVLAAAFYVLLRWSSRARALRLALSVGALYAGSLVSREVGLIFTAWVLEVTAYVVLALLIVLFQPELRRALMQLDSNLLSWTRPGKLAHPALNGVAEAAFSMAAKRLGALIVLPRRDAVDELLEDGVRLAADVTPSILESLFQKTSPLHDGAVVVAQGRITRANVVLPLTQRTDVPFQYGTRHRAGMGLAERSDALVVAISEERGEVTLMRGNERILAPNPLELQVLLEQSLEASSRRRSLFRDFLLPNLHLKFAALALAALVWGMAVVIPGNVVRTITVPVEFTNLPGGFDIGSQSATTVEAQLRGRRWVMDAEPLNHLVVRFDMRKRVEGMHTLRVSPEQLDLPPGITMKSVTPESIAVRVVTRKRP